MNNMRPNEIWAVLNEIDQSVNLASNCNCRAAVSFDVPFSYLKDIKEKNKLAIKINPISGEFLKFTFDWGSLEVRIYCYEDENIEITPS